MRNLGQDYAHLSQYYLHILRSTADILVLSVVYNIYVGICVTIYMAVKCTLYLRNGHLFMAALCNRGAIIFLCCGLFFFLLLSFFFLSFFSSPNLSGRRLDVYHTSAHGVALVRI